jgi:hypothetical protein
VGTEPTQEPRLKPGSALTALTVIPIAAAIVVLITVAVIKVQDAAVAIPAGAAVGVVVVIAALVAIVAVARDLRSGQDTRTPRNRSAAGSDLSMPQGIVLLLSFVLLTVVPAGVVVGAVTLLNEKGNLRAEFALPIIVIVGLTGLLAVLGLLVGVFRHYMTLNKEAPLGLPQGTIQAIIALSLILIFAVVGVYVFASSKGQQRQHVSTQLLTTISTLVVAVAGFYFGSKSTKEAAEAVVRAATPPEDRL